MIAINILLLLLCNSLPNSIAFSLPKSPLRPLSLQATSGGEGGGIFYDGPPHEYREQEQPPPTSTFDFSTSVKKAQQKDVVVIGGGLAGLSAALYLSQIDPTRHVTILERETQQRTTVASFAAAGMLAPQSERLPVGPLLDLCIASRECYRDFVNLVEGLVQEAGEEGRQYLTYGDGKVGYMASGGFLAPAFAGDSVATWSPPDSTAKWLDATQVRELEPCLSADVSGGWWFPEDASVDARRLTCALRAACVASGIEIKIGEQFEVSSLDLLDGECRGLYLADGKYLKTKAVLVANGSWMRQLLPIPVEPHKGQSLSLRMPADKPPLLKRVLFAQDSYIVPKADGRIVVGATVEAGSYDPNVTPAGIMHILHHAMQLVPGLADLPIEESWVGLRPTTPDKGPILGKTSWSNLFLAGGYWRNGVLLAPKTGQMIAQLIAGQELSSSDQALLEAFSWDRFTTPEGSKKMEMNARFAASMHPVHRRTVGAGVAAAVGTELGSYSTARSARDERAKDRASLFGEREDSLERAARMGTEDATAFSGYERQAASNAPELRRLRQSESRPFPENQYISSLQTAATTAFDGSPDAYTVKAEDFEDELTAAYKSINENKASRDIEMGIAEEDDRPDPGFRIYYTEPVSGARREIPPYTPLGDIQALLAGDELAARSLEVEDDVFVNTNKDSSDENHAEEQPIPTGKKEERNGLKNPISVLPGVNTPEIQFDGYSVIQAANSRASRDAELDAMRAARKLNRGTSDVDVSKIGVRRPQDLGL
jgi:glycine oxidase